MLRLWPESLQIGIFPEMSWVQHKRNMWDIELPRECCHEPGAIVERIDSVLQNKGKPPHNGTRVNIAVSDELAVLVALPWQPQLYRQIELKRYAQLCFQKSGLQMDDEWVMHVHFRHYETMGFAYALPRRWLTEMVHEIAARKWKLVNVLPASGIVYSMRKTSRSMCTTLVLLQDSFRFTALTYAGENLCQYEVEPAIGAAEVSVKRLLARMQSTADIESVCWWRANECLDGQLDITIPSIFPDAKVYPIEKNIWRL